MKLLENLPDNGIAKRQFTIQFTDLSFFLFSLFFFFSFLFYHSFAERNSSLSLSFSLSLFSQVSQTEERSLLVSRVNGTTSKGHPDRCFPRSSRAGFLNARDAERHGPALMTRGNGKRGRKIKAFRNESTRSRMSGDIRSHRLVFICLRGSPTSSVSWLWCRFCSLINVQLRCNLDGVSHRLAPELTRNPRKTRNCRNYLVSSTLALSPSRRERRY